MGLALLRGDLLLVLARGGAIARPREEEAPEEGLSAAELSSAIARLRRERELGAGGGATPPWDDGAAAATSPCDSATSPGVDPDVEGDALLAEVEQLSWSNDGVDDY